MIACPTTLTPVPRAVYLDLSGPGCTGCSCPPTGLQILSKGSREAMAAPINHAVTKH